MSKISEILKSAPRQFSMHQELQNVSNLTSAARTKLVTSKDAAAAELEAAAAKLIRIILALNPQYDLGIAVAGLDLTELVTGLGPDMEGLLAKVRELQGTVDARNAEIAELKVRLTDAVTRADTLAASVTAAAVVADEAAAVPPDAPAPKKLGGRKPKVLDVQPTAEEPKADEQV